jgi:hypothetical protein
VVNSGVAKKLDAKKTPRRLAKPLLHCRGEPSEFVVALDALAVYLHKDNRLESISIDELAEIYGDVPMHNHGPLTSR